MLETIFWLAVGAFVGWNFPQPVYGPYVPPYGYHWENLLDANCNCYRTVLVQN